MADRPIQPQEGRTAALIRVFFGARGSITPEVDSRLSGTFQVADLAPVQGRGVLGIAWGETAVLGAGTAGRVRYTAPSDREVWVDAVIASFSNMPAGPQRLSLELNSATALVHSGSRGVVARDTRQASTAALLGAITAGTTGAGAVAPAARYFALDDRQWNLTPDGLYLAAGATLDVVLPASAAGNFLATTFHYRTFGQLEDLNPLTP